MLLLSLLFAVSPVEETPALSKFYDGSMSYTKKTRKSPATPSTKFRSCLEARKAGYTHMKRGSAGYSKGLDRDGDGIACDKVA